MQAEEIESATLSILQVHIGCPKTYSQSCLLWWIGQSSFIDVKERFYGKALAKIDGYWDTPTLLRDVHILAQSNCTQRAQSTKAIPAIHKCGPTQNA